MKDHRRMETVSGNIAHYRDESVLYDDASGENSPAKIRLRRIFVRGAAREDESAEVSHTKLG